MATFARRRGAMEDEMKLVGEDVENGDEDPADPSTVTLDIQSRNASDHSSGAGMVDEEKHHVPFPLSLKQRVQRLKSQRSKRLVWWVTVAVLAVLIILAVSIPLGLWSNLPKESCLDFEDVAEEEYEDFPYLYFPTDGEIDLCHKGDTKLTGRLGVNHDLVHTRKVDYYDYTHDTTLRLSRPGDNYNCLRIEWTGTSSSDTPLQDCYEMEDTLWYGGYESYNPMWPINAERRPMTAFLPHDYLKDHVSHPELFGPILHPIWVTSNGTGILVDENVPLHVSIGVGDKICLQALPYELECVPHSSNRTVLKYTICVYENIQQVWSYFRNHLPRPTATPDVSVLYDPVWSTWAEYKTNITSKKLKDFYDDITSHKFNISQLEIDDGYSKEYGDLSFDEEKFPRDDVLDLSGKVDLTVWVHPFVNPCADEFMRFLNGTSYFLPGGGGNSISLVKWWHDYGAVIDFLNDSVVDQHQERLQNFLETYQLTSFKFDAGEVTYLPDCVHIPALKHFATFSSRYANFVANQTYGSRAEVRVGYFTQNLPIFVRILDRDSNWNSTNGLKSIIPTLLSLGIAGYSFVLPDMIGGNGVAFNITLEATLSEELYIRWVQLNTFLPVMQFSVVPWRFSPRIVDHVRNLTQLHRDLVPRMLVESDLPIVKPLWVVSEDVGEEEREFWERYVGEEFVIGTGEETLLVAPVLDDRASTAADQFDCRGSETPRTVYFPVGTLWNRVHVDQSTDPTPYGTERVHTFCVDRYDTLYFRICQTDSCTR